MMNRYYESIKLGRLGETLPDLTASRLFVDSVSRGLASITVAQEEKAQLPEGEDANTYAYKTIREKVRKSITIKRGDNLGSIAQRYNVTVSDLRKWNRLKGSTIHPGQKLAVYTTVKKTIPIKVVADADESIADLAPSIDTCGINSDDCPEDALADSPQSSHLDAVSDSGKSTSKPETLSKTAAKEPQRFIYHVVQRGDTLWNIAQRYRLSPNQIKELNNIGNSNLLRKGERLKIPKKG
jgi:membrane-bound lytic murein transglycosylase D